jgi:hypothetical protein
MLIAEASTRTNAEIFEEIEARFAHKAVAHRFHFRRSWR